MKKTNKIHDSEKGQSLVELSVTLVVLLVLFAGVIDFGRAFFHFIEMRDAAEEAMIYGSAFPTHCTQIVERAEASLEGYTSINTVVTIDGLSCASASAASNACTGKEIRVEVQDPDFQITMPFLGGVIGTQTLPLKASLSGTILRPACE